MTSSSYYVSWQMTQNMDLVMRVAASAQQESVAANAPIDNVEQWAKDKRWEWSARGDWIAAVQTALETGIADWGARSNVITDGMILSYVQPAVAA